MTSMMDGVRRIAMVETKTIDEDAGGAFQVTTVTRFQLGNHLGSASLEVDASGMVISYEEYHPYGTTAYWSASSAVEVSRKRYRYTGKEKDEETGLHYHGARDYAPWLGRWTAADPAGLVDGLNLYRYARANPILFLDPSGNGSAKAEALKKQLAEKKAYEAQRHSQRTAQNGTGLTPDQIGDIYKTLPELDYAGPPTAEAASEQRYHLSYGEAKREAARQEAVKNPAPTKQERRQAAKAGAWNSALDLATDGFLFPPPFLVRKISAPLRAKEPTDNPYNSRDWTLRQEYDYAQTTVQVGAAAASVSPVGEAVQAARLAAGKLPMLEGIGMGGGGRLIGSLNNGRLKLTATTSYTVHWIRIGISRLYLLVRGFFVAQVKLPPRNT